LRISVRNDILFELYCLCDFVRGYELDHAKCLKNGRERIPKEVRRKIARFSNFACSICGSIPIVIHHIEEWSVSKSNEEKYLIALCDRCHRRIHGEEGNIFSKEELYNYKKNPKKPSFLKDKLPLGEKRKYTFFQGNNLICNEKGTGLIRFPNGYFLTEVDTSNGILKLSVLLEVSDDKPVYLIKDNELMINTHEIWDMKYTGNSLKIWKIIDGKKKVFIHILIFPDIIVIKEMNTVINGIPFQIYKLKSPQRRQLEKIHNEVKSCEERYFTMAKKIDAIPEIYGIHNNIDIDMEIKNNRKNNLKQDLIQYLMFEFRKNFRWKPSLYYMVLSEILEQSSIFKRPSNNMRNVPPKLRELDKKVSIFKKKYSKQLEELKYTVVRYGEMDIRGSVIY